MFNIITLDKPNGNAYINLNGVNHVFSSYQKFAELAEFNHDIMMLSYEPHRNIFHVEKSGGQLLVGEDIEEIKWCSENINKLIQAAHNDGYGQLPPGPSLKDVRDLKLLETDWLVLRHRDQLELNQTTSLTNEQYQKLLSYRSQLRDITKLYSSLDDVVWPILDI